MDVPSPVTAVLATPASPPTVDRASPTAVRATSPGSPEQGNRFSPPAGRFVSVSRYNRYVQAEKNLQEGCAVREESLRIKEERRAQMAAIAAAQRSKFLDCRGSTVAANTALKVQSAQKLLEGARTRHETTELRGARDRQRDAWAEHGRKLATRYNAVQSQKVFSSRVEHFERRRAEVVEAREQSERRQAERHAEESAARAERQDRLDRTRSWHRSKPTERSQEWCTGLKREAAEQVQQQTRALASARRRSTSAFVERASASKAAAQLARRNAQSAHRAVLEERRRQAAGARAAQNGGGGTVLRPRRAGVRNGGCPWTRPATSLGGVGARLHERDPPIRLPLVQGRVSRCTYLIC